MATELAEDDEQPQNGGFDDETMRMLSANLPDKIFRAPDPRIQMAALEAERTNQMTPVLKEELRLRILAKRLERGEPDIETCHTPKTYELTEEEKMKRERRKEQNRRAAKKCREKRKLKNLDVAEKFDSLHEEYEKLHKEILTLRKQREQLMDYINGHIVSGQCKRSPSSQNKCSDGHQEASELQQMHHAQPSNSEVSMECQIAHYQESDLYQTLTKSSDSSGINTEETTGDYQQESDLHRILTQSSNSTSNLNRPASHQQASDLHRLLTQLSSSNTPPTPVSPSCPSPSTPATTSLLPKLSLTLPGISYSTKNYNQSSVNNTVCQIQISSIPQATPINHHHHKQQHNHQGNPPTIILDTNRNQQGFNQLSLFQKYTTTNNNNNNNIINVATAVTTTTSHSNQITALSPKSTLSSRPVISRTPSTTSTFPPPQSPCIGHQSSSLTLTPPPSVSTEQYMVPESPSILTTFTSSSTTTTSPTTMGVSNGLMIQIANQPTDQTNIILTPPINTVYPNSFTTYQLSPAESLSGKSPPDFNITTDKMFDDDDDDDDDDTGGHDLIRILNTLDE